MEPSDTDSTLEERLLEELRVAGEIERILEIGSGHLEETDSSGAETPIRPHVTPALAWRLTSISTLQQTLLDLDYQFFQLIRDGTNTIDKLEPLPREVVQSFVLTPEFSEGIWRRDLHERFVVVTPQVCRLYPSEIRNTRTSEFVYHACACVWQRVDTSESYPVVILDKDLPCGLVIKEEEDDQASIGFVYGDWVSLSTENLVSTLEHNQQRTSPWASLCTYYPGARLCPGDIQRLCVPISSVSPISLAQYYPISHINKISDLVFGTRVRNPITNENDSLEQSRVATRPYSLTTPVTQVAARLKYHGCVFYRATFESGVIGVERNSRWIRAVPPAYLYPLRNKGVWIDGHGYTYLCVEPHKREFNPHHTPFSEEYSCLIYHSTNCTWEMIVSPSPLICVMGNAPEDHVVGVLTNPVNQSPEYLYAEVRGVTQLFSRDLVLNSFSYHMTIPTPYDLVTEDSRYYRYPPGILETGRLSRSSTITLLEDPPTTGMPVVEVQRVRDGDSVEQVTRLLNWYDQHGYSHVYFHLVFLGNPLRMRITRIMGLYNTQPCPIPESWPTQPLLDRMLETRPQGNVQQSMAGHWVWTIGQDVLLQTTDPPPWAEIPLRAISLSIVVSRYTCKASTTADSMRRYFNVIAELNPELLLKTKQVGTEVCLWHVAYLNFVQLVTDFFQDATLAEQSPYPEMQEDMTQWLIWKSQCRWLYTSSPHTTVARTNI